MLNHMEEEIEILKNIAKLHNDILDPIMICITKLGDAGIFWILLSVVLLCFKKTRKIGLTSTVSLIFSVIFTNCIIKIAVDRIRPFAFDETLNVIISKPIDASFPSGHTSASVAAAVAILFWNRKYGIPAVILALLIAFSRLYLQVHFPTDVLGGLILGIIYGISAGIVVKFYAKKKNPTWM